MAAIRAGASARASRPAGARPRSKNASTPFADVNTIHPKAARSGSVKSIGAMRIVGSSSTSAPSASSRARSSLTCCRARVTTIVRPNSGRASNHEKSSAATSPTTIALGDSTPASAIVPNVARNVRWSGRVPNRTAATGVSSSRPPAINALAISAIRPAPMRTTSVPPAAGERVPAGVAPTLGRVLVPGDHREARRHPPVRHRDARVGRRRDRAGDAGHDLEGDARGEARLRLFAAAPEHERVAALQPHDRSARGAVRRRAAR